MKRKQVYYYTDELNDEFFKTNYKTRKIDKNYKYINNNIFYKFASFILYRILATAYAFIYIKLVRRISFKNKRRLKTFKKSGYFIFANHTHANGDAFAPTVLNFPKKCYAITNADNVSIPVMGNMVKMLGALPLPDDYNASKKFMKALEYRFKQNCAIIVYPEAHIWPYYVGIRPFKSTAFKYPIKFNAPTFSCTTTYQATKRGYKTVVYVDGPFYANKSLPLAEQAEDLRNQAYNAMIERSKKSTYEKIKYIKKEERSK